MPLHHIPATFTTETNPFRRMCNVLRREGYETFEEVAGADQWDLLELPNFGVKSLRLLVEMLTAHGIQTGIDVESGPRCCPHCGQAVRHKAI